jgi:hypothetical protein
MNNAGKTQAILATLIITLACLILPIVGSVGAQVVSKPSVPEFKIKYVDNSYDIPPTYGTDQYTGQTIVTQQGQHVDNRSIEITIKNQPFAPYSDGSGNTINRFYDLKYKGSYGNTWTAMYENQTLIDWYDQPSSPALEYGFVIQDYSDQYTIISYHLSPATGKMDFQVQALEGYTTKYSADSHFLWSTYGYIFYGEKSGWSNTQTISFPEGTITNSLNTDPTPEPTVPEFSAITILPLFAIMLLAAVLVKSKSRFLR